MKFKLQQATVNSIVEQLKKSDKVEFDSSLMTAEEFADCFQAAKSKIENEKPTKQEETGKVANLPPSTKGGK